MCADMLLTMMGLDAMKAVRLVQEISISFRMLINSALVTAEK